ncbi:MAG: TldD/PmbA family protein [Candidatus Atribacteria bacterium]|nr:MAG: TldD/PmbA family protein [Candidatus Atribacteria bacterium]
MIGKAKLKAIADTVLSAAQADQTEVLVAGQDLALTRFAANNIHQNVSETDVSVRVRSVVGKKIGVASSNDISPESLKRLVQKAETIASFQQENPEFVSLPEPLPIQEVDSYSESTAMCSAVARAKGVGAILDMSRSNNLVASGAFSTGTEEMMVANSLGISAYHGGTMATVMTVVMSENSSGYAADCAQDVENLDLSEIGRIAVDKAIRSKNPSSIDPGAYTVILEEDAVGTMMFYLGYLGFSALAVQEKRSFMSGRIGEKVTGDNISIWDDGFDPRGVRLPFDFEGVPKQKVMLIENGIARNAVYDSATAAREPGKTSTGHGLPAPNTMGPLPINLIMQPGSASKEEMIASTKKGIWVTRFHYVNPVHPVKAILTGMTRDGTFLIENGKITRPLKNLRFTQSILEAFANAEMLGKELKVIKMGFGNFASCAPAAKINNFTFTGTTEF